MKKVSLTLLTCAVLPAFAAETLMELNTPADWGTAVQQVQEEQNVLEFKEGKPYFGAKSFDIDPEKTYTLSGEFRCTEKPKSGCLRIGFLPRTTQGRIIACANVGSVNPQIGVLAAPVAKGDKSVKLKGISAWKITRPHYMMAMNAKEDLSDLPNFNLSPMFLAGPGKAAGDDVLEFALNRSFGKAYPAGTAVRLHSSGEVFIFVSVLSRPRKQSAEWQTFSGKVSMKKAKGIRAWYPGAGKAAAAIYPSAGFGTVQLRNVRITAE